jgi:uncharacterized protein (TIGR01777 family)
MRLAISGSHGLIGSALAATLAARGDQVTKIVRGAPGPTDIVWDPGRGSMPTTGLDGVDAVVHLAGAGIGDRRWTPAYRREIGDSRRQGTLTLCEALAAMEHPPATLISASAVGWYGGHRGDEILTEASTPGDDFLAEVCQGWEASTAVAAEAGIRVVRMRTGVVLSSRGGALARQLPIFRLGLGGRLGPGTQWLSWISLTDVVGAVLHMLASPALRGAVNATAPEPVTNATFTRALGRALHRPAVLAVPARALRLALGTERADLLALADQRVLPTRLSADGLVFAHPDIDSALRAVASPAAS